MTFTLGPKARSAGYGLAAFDQIGSTNAEAMSRARDGERGPTWFVTTEQTAGRGRRQRPWVAPRGNLASSILEVTDVSPAVAATLGFAAGLSLESALQKLSIEANLRRAGADPLKYALKWPNDVMAEGQKLAGILLEAEAVAGNRLAVVVGIGTNVIAAPEGTPTPATSLAALGVQIGAEERRSRTPGSNSAASGTMAAALPTSENCGWSAPLASASGLRSGPEPQPSKARSIPSMRAAA